MSKPSVVGDVFGVLFMGLSLHELHAAVLGATLLGGVGGDGGVGALAHSGEAAFVDALIHEGVDDGLGAFLAQGVVDGVGAGVVAMALHLEAEVGMLAHELGHAVDLHEGFGLEVGLAGFEGDGIGDDLAFGGEAVVEWHGALGDAHVAQSRVAVERAAGEEEVAGGLH